MNSSITAFRLPFDEQVAHFQGKVNQPTRHWLDVYGAEHEVQFAVAGAMRADLLADLRTAVDRIIAQGGTLTQFRDDFRAIAARYGWAYQGGFGWRTRIIYETNVRSSYMAGRFAQLFAVREHRPYWQYQHSHAVEHPRKAHLAWHGLILRWDDPWWATHFPPNGWGCQCGIVALRESDLVKFGKTGPDSAPVTSLTTKWVGQRHPDGPRAVTVPDGIDPGFEHAPGRHRLAPFIPTPKGGAALFDSLSSGDGSALPLPLPRAVSAASLLPAKVPDAVATTQFLAVLGAAAQTPKVIRDVTGSPLVVGRALFNTGSAAMLREEGLTPYALLIAQTLSAPDEIWVRVLPATQVSKAQSQRVYVARYQLPDEAEPLWVMVEWGRHDWRVLAVLSQSEADEALLGRVRVGYRAYVRPDEG
ncbi:PBECR2 nuclease fold domain-containing protein [Providencia rettgeri]